MTILRYSKPSDTFSILLALLALVSRTTVRAAQTVQAGTCTLTVHLVHFRNNRGNAPVSLYNDRKGFPGDGKRALARAVADIHEQAATVVFKDLKPGVYALSVFHDENRDGRLNKNALGLPREGWGSSNNRVNNFGPPTWNGAKFTLDGSKTIEIRLRY